MERHSPPRTPPHLPPKILDYCKDTWQILDSTIATEDDEFSPCCARQRLSWPNSMVMTVMSQLSISLPLYSKFPLDDVVRGWLAVWLNFTRHCRGDLVPPVLIDYVSYLISALECKTIAYHSSRLPPPPLPPPATSGTTSTVYISVFMAFSMCLLPTPTTGSGEISLSLRN